MTRRNRRVRQFICGSAEAIRVLSTGALEPVRRGLQWIGESCSRIAIGQLELGLSEENSRRKSRVGQIRPAEIGGC